MSFDPKITKIGPNLPMTQVGETQHQAPVAPKEQPAQQLATPDLDTALAVSKQKEAVERQMPRLDRGGASRLEQRFADLELALRKKTMARNDAAKSAMTFVASFAARGSRGARSRTMGLCDLLGDIPDFAADAQTLRIGVALDDALQAGDADGLMAGLTAAAGVEEGGDAGARAFVLAQASQALAMLAEHFPATLEEVESPLDQAFALAEEALSLSPELAEAHVALAQLILLHGDHEAMRDAEALVRRALELDPGHDGATFTLATLSYCRHDPARALALLDEITAHGTARPQIYLLTARAQRATKAFADARATLQRAIQTFPTIAAFHIEASVIARLSKDEAAAAEHRDRAADLLGESIDVDDAIALCFAGHSS